MSKSFRALGLAVSALALTQLPAAAQTKVTNEGISANEIVIGTHQDLSGPIKVWGVPVSNGMKMAVEEINAAGGIHGRKIKLILEDNGYDPKRAVLASQKMVERDKVFAMVGPMGSPTVLAAQDILFDAGVLQLFPLTAAEFTFKFDPAKPQERLKFNNLLPYVESTRAAVKYMIEAKNFKKPCIMHQDDEYGKNVLDGFTQQLTRDEADAGLGHQLQARRFRLQRAGRQDEVRRLRHGRARHRASARPSARWAKPRSSAGTSPSSAPRRPTCSKCRRSARKRSKASTRPPASKFPYEDTAKGKVKDWLANYKKMFSTDANTQAIIGYNAMMTFALLRQQGGQGPDRPEDARRAGIRRQVPRHLQLAADQVLQDRPSRQHDHPGPADQERPLGAGEGRPDVLSERFAPNGTG